MFGTWISLSPEQGRNYEQTFKNLADTWKEYAAVGAPGEDQRKRLEEFMRRFGAPLTAASGLETEHWKNPSLTPGALAPEESVAQIVLEAHNAHVCNEMLIAAQRGWAARLNTPVSIQLNSEEPQSIVSHALPAYKKGQQSEYKRKLQNAAYVFVRKVAAYYVPELSVRLQQSGDETIFGHALPGLRPALWLSFLTSIPGTVTPERWLTCRNDNDRRGCGQPFPSDQPNVLYCPDCKRRINTENTRAKRAK